MEKRRRRKRVTPMDDNYGKHLDSEDNSRTPHSFVINNGPLNPNARQLMTDFKKVMRPNTAEKLKARRRNTLKDFVAMAGPLNVSHVIIFSVSDMGLNLRIGRLPQGPTLTFKIEQYSLIGDVYSTIKRQLVSSKSFLHMACLMTNLKPSEGNKEHQMCAKMFLDMFPTINPQTVSLKSLQRTCLIYYDEAIDTFEFRHYAIRLKPQGISKAVKKLIGHKVPNLGKFKDVTDFMQKSEMLSDSEAEEDISKNTVENAPTRSIPSSVVRLGEIGPRITMKLVKIEDGLCSGFVLFHKFITLTPEEKLQMEKRRIKQLKLKEQRRRQQAANVKRKEKEKEQHKLKCLGLAGNTTTKSTAEEEEQMEEDKSHYLEEIGEKPDEELFKRAETTKEPGWKKKIFSQRTKKKLKLE